MHEGKGIGLQKYKEIYVLQWTAHSFNEHFSRQLNFSAERCHKRIVHIKCAKLINVPEGLFVVSDYC
jgi:hypothetical protein